MNNDNSKVVRIPLSKRGKNAGKYEAIVSIEDADLAQHGWHTLDNRNSIYATRNIRVHKKYKAQLMHRIIMERKLGYSIPDNMYVDHIDSNSLNNTRPNLRLATFRENVLNMGMRSNNKSGFKGVHQLKTGRWVAQIRVNGKKKHLGQFATAEEAFEAVCKERDKSHGEFANHGNTKTPTSE